MATVARPQLSPRQQQILALMARGVRVREIAAQLGLSETTVRNHVRGILKRLGCHSQLEAVARAREWHLL
ncbi:MAG TPA: LuxR C-terminal-related transcriptional regulator [Gaiellaceae bacterium]|nr:LuxR C-terminal-related transcriptional regulator [Gaiellaceae bacterium]